MKTPTMGPMGAQMYTSTVTQSGNNGTSLIASPFAGSLTVRRDGVNEQIPPGLPVFLS
jgi:hypothetical protein